MHLVSNPLWNHDERMALSNVERPSHGLKCKLVRYLFLKIDASTMCQESELVAAVTEMNLMNDFEDMNRMQMQ